MYHRPEASGRTMACRFDTFRAPGAAGCAGAALARLPPPEAAAIATAAATAARIPLVNPSPELRRAWMKLDSISASLRSRAIPSDNPIIPNPLLRRCYSAATDGLSSPDRRPLACTSSQEGSKVYLQDVR